MNTWLNYILEANAGLLLFLLVYRLLLQNETQFTYKRAYLLAGIVFSLTFPLITMPAGNDIIPSIGYSISTEWTEISSDMEQRQNQGAAMNGWTLLTYGYLSIVFILSLRLLYQVAKVLSIVARHRSSGTVVTIDNPHVYAFSFFRYIFISSAHAIHPDEKERIIQHETVHIRKWHSVDMLLIEVVRILFWFNPLLTWYKNELSTVHEYEADAVSVKPDEIDQYCSLLAKSAIASAGLTLANHFNNSLTLKRIAMMKTIKKRMKQWKTLFILSFTTLFFVAVSCQDQIIEDIKDASKNAALITEYPQLVQDRLDELKRQYPSKEYQVMLYNSDAHKLKRLEEANNTPSHMEVITIRGKDWEQTGNEQSYVILEYSGHTGQLSRITKSDDDVFLVVEESASPVDGMQAFYESLVREMKMPEEARAKGVEGKVFVELIIEPDGTTSNHQVLKGIGSGCDEEAVRALKASNVKWNPAKQRGIPVRQKYVIPITFVSDQQGNLQDQMMQFRSPEKVEPVSENGVFLVVENSAVPIGGMEALYSEIGSKMRMPAEARRNGVSGKVFVEMIVEPDGTTSGHKLIKGIGSGCDEEAFRVVSSLTTRWSPGQQDGKPVRQKFVIPIAFINQESTPQPVSDKAMIVSSRVRTVEGKPVVSGTVIGTDGKPLPGINIVVAGKTYGTVSDRNGNFELALQDDSGEIVLSFIGYKTERIFVKQ
jgi:TonB family protein